MLDEGDREGIALEPGTSIPRARDPRSESLDRSVQQREALRIHNGPEFTASILEEALGPGACSARSVLEVRSAEFNLQNCAGCGHRK